LRRLRHQERYAFAQEFKAARASALRDAEAFEEHIFVLERLGSYLWNKPKGNLGKYKKLLLEEAARSTLAFEAASRFPSFHVSLEALYEEARKARNDAMHHGAIARHLSRHAQEIALIMEDALMDGATKVREFMVRNPACTELWHPLSSIRRTMLLNAFSFLPFEKARGDWHFVSDLDLAAFLQCGKKGERTTRMLLTLGEALEGKPERLSAQKAAVCHMETSVQELARSTRAVPHLVLDDQQRLLGIITPFDLL